MKTQLYAKAVLICLLALAPLASAQARAVVPTRQYRGESKCALSERSTPCLDRPRSYLHQPDPRRDRVLSCGTGFKRHHQRRARVYAGVIRLGNSQLRPHCPSWPA